MKSPFSGCLRLFLASTLIVFNPLRLSVQAGEILPVWPDQAPGETTKETGTTLPGRASDKPPITRVEKVTSPTMEVFAPENGGNGVGVLILPGGGFRYVVPDLEGSEAAKLLNKYGITAFVLNYRTTENGPEGAWQRPLQDSERAIRFIRANVGKWKLDPKKIGLLAFSAGGQVGAIHIGDRASAYETVDAVDKQSPRPDFAMLIYPWNLVNNEDALMPEIKISEKAPPTFLVHTHDDNSSSLGAVYVYAALKKHNVSAEIHIYHNGGHGYGIRPRPESNIGTWKDRAVEWLKIRGLAVEKQWGE